MSPRRLSVLFLLVSILPACGYDTGADLRPAVEKATPAGARSVSSCGGSSGLIESPSYGCVYVMRGDVAAVTNGIAKALRTEGFAVSCRRPGELRALRGNVRMTAQVTGEGLISTSGGVANVLAGGYRPEGARPVPRGSVVVNLDASRQVEASAAFWRSIVAEGGRCDRAPRREHPLELCLTWWNGPVGFETRAAARRRHAGPAVEIAHEELPALSKCTYTMRLGDGFARVNARFDHGDWVWPRLHKVPEPRRFRPNARLEPHGLLGLRG